MGLTVLDVDLANQNDLEAWQTVRFLVDSGAVYSVVPRTILEQLAIKPIARQEFRLADGQKIARDKGVAIFRYAGRFGGADVIFGEQGDSCLLGALTLEALGFSLDPLRRELNPLPMILAAHVPSEIKPGWTAT